MNVRDHPLRILPEPKQVVLEAGFFRLDADTRIVLLPSANNAAFGAASSLQREIQESTSLCPRIEKTAEPTGRVNAILLAADYGAAQAFLGELPEQLAPGPADRQAYRIQISSDRVLVIGAGDEGLYYAIQTLRQICRLEHSRWPALFIADWPSLSCRGLMLDVSRGKVPTLETLRLLIDHLSLFKANVLQLYTEHTFVFPHHPRIGESAGSLSGNDIMELDAYARAHHVELMPNLNSFGHCEHLLSLPGYRDLAESAAAWSLCPTDERTYELIDDLYGDLLPAFSSKTLNIGCDETYDLGKGRSKEAVAHEGTGRLYLRHILRLYEIARRRGARIQLWGDILLHYPELVGELPQDITLLDWHYEAADDYPSVRVFAESGREFWVCPGTSSWNTLFPRIENSNANIRALARTGVEHGARGLLNTDWGDSGHYQPIGQCWYGYAFGAAQAWSGGVTEDAVFDASFAPLYFGASGDSVVSGMRALGRLNTLPGMARPNASRSIHALLDEPLVGPLADEIPAETARELVHRSDEAVVQFYDAMAISRDRRSLEEMALSAQLMGLAGRKLTLSREVRALLARPIDDTEQMAVQLERSADAFAALNSELGALTLLFQEQWLRRARASEIGISLGHFGRLSERLEAARGWLAQRAAQQRAGKTPGDGLSAYAQEAESYEYLGQGFLCRFSGLDIAWD